MLVQDVLNWKKEKVGKVELDPKVFGREISNELLHEVVRWQLNSRRQGTHMTKTKGLVSGGGKKPFKQKGTGGARQGSNRSILMPGGGTAFGPQPRSYTYALPKKARKVALSVALSYLVKEGKFIVLNDIDSTGKTKDINTKLSGLGLKKAFVVDDVAKDLVVRASKNLAKFKYVGVAGLNVYDLLKYDSVVVSQSAVDKIAARCSLEG
jgi:large subunit ribosomal protein L4